MEDLLAKVRMKLFSKTVLRDYQKDAIESVFSDKKINSGIILLPCGAGKTLVGIGISCHWKKNTLVVCTSSESALQWQREFDKFTGIPPKAVAVIDSRRKDFFEGPIGVIITTYNMISSINSSKKIGKTSIDRLRDTKWGVVLLDETHVVPAKTFAQVLALKSESFVGLTATMVREDDKIDYLYENIGPLLYRAPWEELKKKGFIADVRCIEIPCEMKQDFLDFYQNNGDNKRLIAILNPEKIRCCQFLIKFHEERGDKILVFCDDIFALEFVSLKLGKPVIHGSHSEAEKLKYLEGFRNIQDMRTLFISRIGDNSIDLPEANVVIQISSQYGSRRQEAQRLGRINRPKKEKKNMEGPDAFFYTLVSSNTSEIAFSENRKQFLEENGYKYSVVTSLPIDEDKDLLYSTRQECQELMEIISNHRNVDKIASKEEE